MSIFDWGKLIVFFHASKANKKIFNFRKPLGNHTFFQRSIEAEEDIEVNLHILL
jgi:hypothetical protein